MPRRSVYFHLLAHKSFHCISTGLSSRPRETANRASLEKQTDLPTEVGKSAFKPASPHVRERRRYFLWISRWFTGRPSPINFGNVVFLSAGSVNFHSSRVQRR